MKKYKISFIICPNGFGHFVRCINIIDSILEIKDYNISVFCQSWQRDLFSFRKIINHKNITWCLDFMEPGLTWPPNLKNKNLNNWFEEIESMFLDSNLIISDNLTAPLLKFNNVILMGSFLWSDVYEYAFPNDKSIKKFVSEERSLLKEKKPEMICIKDIAMKNVIELTNPIQVPWMFEDKNFKINKNSLNKIKVGLLPGRKDINRHFLRVVPELLNYDEIKLYLPPYLSKMINIPKSKIIKNFNYSNEHFDELDIIIGRPGIGLITDCLKSNTFLIPIYEKNNIEMIHNAAVIDKKKWGTDLNGNYSLSNIVDKIKKLNFYNENQFNDVIFGGKIKTRNFIINKVKNI
jgi:hypothetical protein